MNKMKYIIVVFCLAVLTFGCEDAFELQVKNKNQPTPDALSSQEGIIQASTGMYASGFYWRYWFEIQGFHEIMGDAIFIPWGNYGWRWANQPTYIILDDGTKVLPPNGGAQGDELRKRNSRAYGWDNAFRAEWSLMYYANNQANLLLLGADSDISFTGNAEIKKKVIKAWAYYWKGLVYARIGSLYAEGLIVDEYGVTNSNYVSNTQLIAESNSNFNSAIQELNGISDGDADYTAMLSSIIPSYLQAKGLPTPSAWQRAMNTYKARNLLANTKTADMTVADWNNVLSLANDGIKNDDAVFVMTSDATFMEDWVPAYVHYGWMFASERLVQDFKDGDARKTRGLTLKTAPTINVRGRGIQYGTEWDFIDGGEWTTTSYETKYYPIGCSYEENALMLAEAKINTGSIDDGLAHIDEVRTFQNSSLADVSNTGLDLNAAKEELRIERRIGLLFRGVAFYDARRWGVTDPIENGGGRTGCVVWDAQGNKHVNATFNYNYLPYWDVPADETDFNPKDSGGSAINLVKD
ncbi:MAG: hypothetical protein N4A74_13690 [Carboxylicivirga sp.]|jgi:hypothetical protein|nr:hypothetical protein [Carboxylicivirga sp.]